VVLGLLACASAYATDAAPAPSKRALAATRALQPGLWRIEVKGQAPLLLCLANTEMLLQLEHRETLCPRFVIEDLPTRATVHYSCPNQGWGRTVLRIETPRATGIDTQGISNKTPFAYVASAHWQGNCSDPAQR
jgi:hypothetical protein